MEGPYSTRMPVNDYQLVSGAFLDYCENIREVSLTAVMFTYKGSVPVEDILYRPARLLLPVRHQALEVGEAQLEDVAAQDQLCEDHLQKYLQKVGKLDHCIKNIK